MKKKKLNLSGTVAFITALLVLVIFIPINLIVSYYDKGFDMTPSGKYTLNEKTVQLLDETADQHIDIYGLYELEEFKRSENSEYLPLYHTLTQLEQRDNITLTCFQPDENAALSKELDPEGYLGIEKGDTFVKCNGVIKKISRKKVFQTGADDSKQYAGEELLAAAIKTCSSGSLPTVYFLTGHGDKTIGTNFPEFAAILKTNNYDVQELDLDEAGAVPDNAKIIYLAGPTEDITAKEKDLLLEYADNGGAMSFLIDPCDTEGRFYNIEAVMEEFGLVLDYNIVTETTPANMLDDPDQNQSENYLRVEYPAGSQVNSEFTQDLTTDLNTLISNSVPINGYTLISGISYPRSLTEIPEDSFPAASYIERASIIKNTTGLDGSYTTVSKAMGGDEITAKEADEKLSGIDLDFGYYSYNKKTGAKLVVIGTTAPIDTPRCTPTVEIPKSKQKALSSSGTRMLTVFSNTWLYDSEIEFGVGNKINAYDYMKFSDSSDATKTIVALFITPVVIVLFGLAVWLKRRNS
ncbi:Gldg family protein [Ruminococcus flavefaciens]|uniref:Gldg family protein n=1 Tax=Ruminococcus flavefaciens TaxID=1265 RepID=UPI000466E2B1|nr:Gldg family protein [Ruminococcus flavefaciens]